jgi:hypothetical protein
MSNVIAQTGYPYCNINYHYDTIAYNPAPYGVGNLITTSSWYPDTFSASIPIGFTFNYCGNNYTNIIISPYCFVTFNTSNANQPVNDTSYNYVPSIYDPFNSIFLSAQQVLGAVIRYNHKSATTAHYLLIKSL